MPQLTDTELTTIRQGSCRLKSRLLSVVPRSAVVQARANGAAVTTDTGSVIAIPYDTLSGSLADVLPGMTLDIGTSSGGHERGSLRVRTVDVNYIYVQETSAITVSDNDYLTIVDEFLPRLIPVRRVEVLNEAGVAVDFTEYHDYDQAYSDQNTAIIPKANIVAGVSDDEEGYYLPQLAGWAEVGVSYRTITLSAIASKALADGAALSSYQWDIGDCTFVSGDMNSVTITIRVPVGFRHLHLTVFDDNGKAHTMHLPLWTHDETYLPLSDFKITSDETEDGRVMRFEFYGADSSLSPTILPRYSTVYYWKVATFGRTADAAPPQYRHGALLWVLKDATPLRHKRKGAYSIEAGGAAEWMKSVYGFPQTILNPGETPDVWYEMQKITGARLLHYVLRTYTTLLDLVNLFVPDLTDEIEQFNTKVGTIWAQLEDIARRSGYCTVGCDSLGGIWLRPEYFYLETRADRTTTIGFTPADWALDDPPEIPDDQTEEVGQVVGYGASYDPTITEGEKSAVYGARAPGATPGAGKGRETAPYQTLPLTGPAETLARWTGEHYARKNNPRKQVRLKLIHNLDVIEPAWNEPITITDTRGNLRALMLNGDKFLVKKVSIRHNYDRGKPDEEITLMLEGVTTGKSGLSFTLPPPTTTTEPPVIVYNPPPVVTYKGNDGLSANVDKIACFCTNNKVHIVSGLRQLPNGIVPTQVTHALSLTGTLASFAVRADSYLGSTVNGYVATTHQARTISDIASARTLGTAYSYPAGTDYTRHVQLQTERGNPDWALVTVYHNGGGTLGVRAYRTEDGGANWAAQSSLPTAYDTAGSGWASGLWMNPAGNGEAIISAARLATNPPLADFWRTMDYGATLTIIDGDAGDWPCGCIVKPYSRADVIFHGYVDFVGVQDTALKRIIGSTQTDISPLLEGYPAGVGVTPGSFTNAHQMRAISVADDDPNCLVACVYSRAVGKRAVVQTFNALDAVPTWNILIGPVTSMTWNGAYYVSRNLIFLIGDLGWIGILKYTDSWSLYSYQISGAGNIVGICGV
jgi:hypothetical protein